jgi:hypothetical protein
VSRVCAPTLPLTNNTGSRVYSNEVPSFPDWPVWTRAQMKGSAAARGEGSADDERESAPLDESAPALHPTIMAEKPGDDESPENRGRVPLPKIMAARSGEPEPSLEEKVRQIRVTMSARAETISVLEIGATTHAETISVQGIGAPTSQHRWSPPKAQARPPRRAKPPTWQEDTPKPLSSRTRRRR